LSRDRRFRRGPRLDPELLGQDLREHLGRFEQALGDLTGGEGVPAGFDPERFLAPGLPRVRPLLVVLSAHAASEQGHHTSAEDTEHVAVAAELLHVAIVIHDAALGRQGGRRRRAARRLLGGAAAWLGGNHLTLRALELARHAPSPDTVGELLDALREISDGHALAQDLDGHLPTPLQSIELADGRTAAVFSFACRAGARVAGADRKVVHTLGRYGRHAGLAWHLTEDLALFNLDPDDRDEAIEERLLRGLSNHAVALAATDDAALARDWARLHHDADRDRLRSMTDRVARSGAVQEGRRRVLREVWAARQALHSLPPTPARDSLDHLAASLTK